MRKGDRIDIFRARKPGRPDFSGFFTEALIKLLINPAKVVVQ